MDKFNYSYKTKVYFGVGAAREALAAELGRYGERVMLTYGGGSIRANGIYDEVRSILEGAGKKVIDFAGIMPNPTYAKVQEGAKLAREEKVDLILAVGGGSVIDCSKVISAQAYLAEDIYDYEYSAGRVPTAGIPLAAIVTASGTGAEMNNGAVITYEEKKWKGALWGTGADFAVLDPEYTRTVPARQVLSGAFDTLSHAMETYMGRSDRDNVSDDIALAVMRNTVVNMRRLIADPADMQARSNLMWDSAMAENGILKCGRVTDFQAHQIEHQLGAYTDCNHGEGLAVIHPAYYRHIADAAAVKLSRLGKVVFGIDTKASAASTDSANGTDTTKAAATAAVEALAAFIKDCGLPTHLTALKSKVPVTPELLREVAGSCNIIKTNPRELTYEEIYDILMESL